MRCDSYSMAIAFEDTSDLEERLYITSAANDHDDDVQAGPLHGLVKGRGDGSGIVRETVLGLVVGLHMVVVRTVVWFVLGSRIMFVWHSKVVLHCLAKGLCHVSIASRLADGDVKSAITFRGIVFSAVLIRANVDP
jgi:hypothetical protein